MSGRCWTLVNRVSQAGGVIGSVRSSRRGQVSVAAGVVPLAVIAVLAPFRSTFPNTAAALVLVVVLVAVAMNSGRTSGILASASAAVWFDFFLTKPYERFTITHSADIETTVLLLLVGTAVTELAVQGQRYRVTAAADTEYIAAIGEVVDFVGSGASARAVIEQVTVRLLGLLDLRGCRFERSWLSDLPRLDQDGRLRIGEEYWDLDRRGLPATGVEMLATHGGTAYGRFVLDPIAGSKVSPVARRVATVLVSQVAAALELQTRMAG